MKRQKNSTQVSPAHSIKVRLITTCVLFAVIPMVIMSVFSTRSFTSTLRDTSMQLVTDMVKQTRANLNYFTGDIEKNITKFVLSNLNNERDNSINKYMSAKDRTEQLAGLNALKTEIINVSTLESAVESAALISEDGTIIGSLGNTTEEQQRALLDIDFKDEDDCWYYAEDLNESMYYIKKVKNSISGKYFGVIVSKIKFNTLVAELDEMQLLEGASAYVINEAGDKICMPSDSEASDEISENIKSFVSSEEDTGSTLTHGLMLAYATGNSGWKIVVEIPEASLTSAVDNINLMVTVGVMLVIFLAVIVGYIFSRSFTVPIINLMNKMKAAEQGDFTVQVANKGKDEMSMLCNSFNIMLLNIRSLVQETKEAIKTILDNGIVLSTNTEQSVSAFEQLASSIESIAEGSSEQAEDAHNSAKAMNSLSGSIQKVRSNTQNIFENAKDAQQMISDATTSIELLNSSMSSSMEVSGKIQGSIIKLSELTGNIRDILSFVDDISEQTNLLALNASIEAARVGEQGKGFAVVAQEVRNLAEQSKESTKHVRETLNTIEKQTDGTVLLVKEANSIFSKQEQAVEKAYRAFNQIIDRLTNMDSELEHVNSQVIDMQSLKDEMNAKIGRITVVTESNASATEQVNALSSAQLEVMEKLTQISNELKAAMECLEDRIRYFKI